MDHQQLYNKRILALGYVTFGILLLMALHFYLLRIIMPDASFITFEILRTQHLSIQSNRFGSGITQMFPLLGAKAGMPLKEVMMLYSSSFVLVALAWYLISVKLFKNSLFGMIIVLASVLMVSDTFFWIQSEYIQGMFFLMMVFALITSAPDFSKLRWLNYPLSVFGLVFAMLYHPLMIIPISGFWAYWTLHDKKYRNVGYLSLLPIVWAFYLAKPLYIPHDSYDAEASKHTDSFWATFPDLFSIKATKNFLAWCLWDFYLFPIFFFGISAYYVVHKHWLKLGWLACFTLGYILFINGCYSDGPPKNYMEHMYIPVGFLLALPFLADIVPNVPFFRNNAFTILVVIISIRLVSIYVRHYHYQNRLNWHQEMLNRTSRMSGHRFYVSEADAPMQYLDYSWGTSTESLLFSSIQHPDSARTWVVIADPAAALASKPGNACVVLPWVSLSSPDVPKRYFRMRDDNFIILTPDKLPEKNY